MLSEIDRDLLAWLREGGTIAQYARDHSYSESWSVWKSREIRRKLGAATIGEAVAMSEQETGVSRADFDKLFSGFTKLSEAVDELAKRPNDTAQQQQVRERELDVKDHAKALGLSLEDVEKLKGEKEYAKFKAMQERLDQERADEDDELDDESGSNGKGLGDVIRDGLGGITNKARQ